MKKTYLLLSLLLAMAGGIAHADDAAIQQSLRKLGLQQTEIQPSPLPGMKTVLSESGVLYVSEDGKHFIQGPLYDVSGNHPVNVINQLLDKKVEALKSDMIVYKAPKEQHVITVFTDITCGYCRKLHSQIADYNALGITVRYLAFPREGLTGEVEKQMKSIWCAADRNKAFDAAMKGSAPQPVACDLDLSRQYKLGILYGIQGTPAILLQNGTLIPGYQGPQELKTFLDSQKSGSE
ncbi:bifunctional protein-disulfide isomerase/oxidoreductase DsbC [Erwinia sp. OLTSP20]|uniref:bifunctional protein-disulfide isomerase/oxidoreductase DsbC n=1 Tax=unclassified Erwinia TaxID=2622719 RepID=UPI000C1A3456|nr:MULTISPECIES: bifunctional protein-disulfide isomerase/oxidoreductase DsbC [unclassified Erwinia]PIJ48998.1 bifunctional protein-disulfide isomerase/oxidoreductase DsbC [Erwinia sp. OAMSP11]PIJ74991.1 bifunctional protein-disulfide isomerase/oxidoreductase DsbC [Erwinia sp. OLSSP12]PIJ79682.1 bifunctional protein-disulfide isomerase/oxidoreductase DsbC [Erwinia sp. OLCASP19]PIJ80467.1 bifunctional protein-disulfide isomerase/oxidoreductase DsbC [Erwinia sp. OLMTSP26]PIJ82582.1 bifunctional 